MAPPETFRGTCVVNTFLSFTRCRHIKFNMLLQLLSSLALAGTALCAPTTQTLGRRGEVDHDSLDPIATRVQDGPLGAAIEKFNPRLHIASGCQPYTAVDDSGNTKQVATPPARVPCGVLLTLSRGIVVA